MKKLAFTFLYTVEVLFASPGRNKRRQPYFATATVEMMNVEKDRLARSATSTCLETAASVPDFMRTHVEEAEETWDCSIILVYPGGSFVT